MEKRKKPIHKKWWVWLIVVLLIAGIFGDPTDDIQEASEEESTTKEVKEIQEEPDEEKTDEEEVQEEEIDSESEEVSEEKSKEKETSEEIEKNTEEEEELTREEEIQELVKKIVDEEFSQTEITAIDVNLDMGRNNGGYIVLPKLVWEVKNRANTTRDMLTMYSDHLAAVLADEPDINEITVFWEVPYHLEGSNTAKFNYEKADGGMAIGEVWFDPLLRD